ncbi:flavin reductase family protein [Curvivirga sp.]|uniref:flavin reductase family protein n=1 Tax=Curvivirga sp. TaxID=2856848 RepID=UPI003B5930FC
MSDNSIDPMEFRNCCGRFATGVTVVTGKLADGSPVGVTANSFSSVSLDPALVLFCLDKKALSFDAFSLDSHFAFNILSEDQMDASNNFASQGIDKFEKAEYRCNEYGVPILKDTLATIECKMHAIHDGGDHQIIVGEVTSMAMKELTDDTSGRPLLYFSGSYGKMSGK